MTGTKTQKENFCKSARKNYFKDSKRGHEKEPRPSFRQEGRTTEKNQDWGGKIFQEHQEEPLRGTKAQREKFSKSKRNNYWEKTKGKQKNEEPLKRAKN